MAGRLHLHKFDTSASAWKLCRASQRNAQGESLVPLTKEGLKALYCLCMHETEGHGKLFPWESIPMEKIF